MAVLELVPTYDSSHSWRPDPVAKSVKRRVPMQKVGSSNLGRVKPRTYKIGICRHHTLFSYTITHHTKMRARTAYLSVRIMWVSGKSDHGVDDQVF